MLYIRKHIWQGIKTFTIWPAFQSDHRQSDRVMYTDYRNWNGMRNGNCFYPIFVFCLWIEKKNTYKMTVTSWKYEKQYFCYDRFMFYLRGNMTSRILTLLIRDMWHVPKFLHNGSLGYIPVWLSLRFGALWHCVRNY